MLVLLLLPEGESYGYELVTRPCPQVLPPDRRRRSGARNGPARLGPPERHRPGGPRPCRNPEGAMMTPTATSQTDRARREWFLLRFSWHMQDFPQKQYRQIKRDLRRELTTAGADVGMRHAVADLGRPRTLADGNIAGLVFFVGVGLVAFVLGSRAWRVLR